MRLPPFAAARRQAAVAALGWQHRFVSNNIGKWAGRFCRAVEAAAETPFYAQFAKLLRTFIAGEKSEIVDRLSKIDGKFPSSRSAPSERRLL